MRRLPSLKLDRDRLAANVSVTAATARTGEITFGRYKMVHTISFNT